MVVPGCVWIMLWLSMYCRPCITFLSATVLLCTRSCRILGLDVCIDTVCGNDLLKGISGGQKKRVTSGEMMVGRLPVLFMDEISTGLDRCGLCKVWMFRVWVRPGRVV